MTTCFVCDKPDDTDRHHVIPVEYSGPKNGKTVDLCPTCHRLMHRTAEYLYKHGKLPSKFESLKGKQREKALILVKYIANAKRAHENSSASDKLKNDARNMVQISCTAEELALFHSVKEQMGMKSLARAIKALMIQHYQKQLGVKNYVANETVVPKPSSVAIRKQAGRSKVRGKKQAKQTR